MSLNTIAIGIVISMAAIGVSSTIAYNKGYENGENHVKVKIQEEQDKHDAEVKRKNSVIASLSRNLETLKGNQKQLERTTNETIKKELSDAVYTQCVVPPSGVRDLSNTAERLNAIRNSGKSSNEVPGNTTTNSKK